MNNIMNVKNDLEESKVGMLFNSIDDLIKYYKMYEKDISFEISKKMSGKWDDGELK